MTESTLDFQLEQAIGLNVNRAAFLMTEEIARRFAGHGYALSAQDFGILFRLSKQGAMTQVEIVALMLRDKTTITRRIDGLVKKNLVTRTPAPDDRRYFQVSLTPDGYQALEIMVPLVRNFQQEVLSDIPDDDKAITIKTLKHISNKLIDIKIS
ncbi:MAG: MarR family transcriptional regulator [Zetaproteobacteria bacterium CG_4_9_14_3_um_filter_49_83]|nr:MAG: MarR family transcriptional regulator [Zetaproteobacteria bacterium CG1_02_49_23]PIQ33766.1 MAG: MarR family transcriptional regulator [Zetaproteobacteria bacterium CG17_big_fil_post_rev_8_21_14_2_50_50_13]PIV30732.1 MAG: MarR family transcriptional regulator [Zetaproteobacteria bacterium CG02_land_8_20_14_3_00_50_9]PIY55084.1 MAG: MarR family transcriptional regulator [Zetaproteobacteria bacterium CG_4_10_14_0_8_um_filter_49_80]PJA36550.1 MAG: MarR family transcriptional regulator [Zet